MTEVRYMTGFGNDFATEALAGALPTAQNSPQRPPFGLYAEKFSAAAFTAPRAENARSWLYRIRPSVIHDDFAESARGLVRTAPCHETPMPPNPLRWKALPWPDEPTDFLSGLTTLACNGDALAQRGIAIHVYRATRPMETRFFYNADGEMLLVPEHGAIRAHTEMGILELAPGWVGVIPRGIKFRIACDEKRARGYVCENYGARLRLPERGPIGTDGLANSRDFEAPVAAYDDLEGDFELCVKFGGRLWSGRIRHSPLDVVAWHGNLAPYRYDLRRFNTIGSISYDHPDPSIFTVLTSPSAMPGTANVDLVVFPPRWLVAEDTFRPPWFHRNVMSEYMGLVYGQYDAKAGGFEPGGGSLHNCMTAHGPDAATVRQAGEASLEPQKLEDTMAFMFESCYPIEPTDFAMQCDARQADYSSCWQVIPRTFTE